MKLSELVSEVNQDQELELLETLSDRVADEMNVKLRLFHRLYELEDSHINDMILIDAKELCKGIDLVDPQDVADLAMDRVDYDLQY